MWGGFPSSKKCSCTGAHVGLWWSTSHNGAVLRSYLVRGRGCHSVCLGSSSAEHGWILMDVTHGSHRLFSFHCCTLRIQSRFHSVAEKQLRGEGRTLLSPTNKLSLHISFFFLGGGGGSKQKMLLWQLLNTCWVEAGIYFTSNPSIHPFLITCYAAPRVEGSLAR